MNDITKPKIIIGMPAYNASEFIHNSITSLLNQSYKNFILIISDNGSTDDTKLICEQFVKQDKRIKYIHHKINRGYVWNFNFLLNQANSEYFMWAGADDIWHPNFIEKNINFLEKNETFVGSTSEVELFYKIWEEKDFQKFNEISNNQKYEWVHPLIGTYEEKVKFLFNFCRFEYAYSIYRTKILKKCIIKQKFLSWEIPVILKLLKFGDLNVEDGVMTYKYMGQKIEPDYHKKLFHTTRNQNFSMLLSLFPFVSLTLHVFKIVGPKIFFKYLSLRFFRDNYRAQRLVFLDIFSRK
jgi:glycosyltransferase involved in cell wall biosynthesis